MFILFFIADKLDDGKGEKGYEPWLVCGMIYFSLFVFQVVYGFQFAFSVSRKDLGRGLLLGTGLIITSTLIIFCMEFYN